jgi:hypothetical protein
MTNNDTHSSDVNDKDVVDMNKGGEHSPLPWKYSEGFSNGNIGIVDEDGEWRILAEGDPENINAENDLKHIVHCVNNYPVLVADYEECKCERDFYKERCEQLELQNERLKESVQNYKELTKDLTLIWRQNK